MTFEFSNQQDMLDALLESGVDALLVDPSYIAGQVFDILAAYGRKSVSYEELVLLAVGQEIAFRKGVREALPAAPLPDRDDLLRGIQWEL